VNTVTFFDNGRRFVSSSDDKTLRVWEFGIPVQIKYIADPSMHSMPAIAPNPAGTAIVCQSLDNQARARMCSAACQRLRDFWAVVCSPLSASAAMSFMC
jgi:pre-mRNA-processing factor 17